MQMTLGSPKSSVVRARQWIRTGWAAMPRMSSLTPNAPSEMSDEKRLRVDPEAELVDAAKYYEGHQIGLGADFLQALRERFKALRVSTALGARPPGVSPELP